MKRTSNNAVVLRQRLYLAIVADCRAGGVRRHCMKKLAEKVGAYHSMNTLESDLLLYAGDLMVPATVTRLFNWVRAVELAQQPIPVPAFLPRHQVALAA